VWHNVQKHFRKCLILLDKKSAFCFGILLKPASDQALGNGRGGYPQSYPQDLWIAGKSA